MTPFEKWWNSVGLTEHVRLCKYFEAPATNETAYAGKHLAWIAWNAGMEKAYKITSEAL